MWDSRAMPSAKDKKPPIPPNPKGFGMFNMSASRTMQNAGGNIQVMRLGRAAGGAGRPGITEPGCVQPWQVVTCHQMASSSD